ncbi:MAG: hypothetical protein Q9215_007842 [Flavoplaca cf. flavocitrina]
MDLIADIRSHISEVASDPAGKALDPRLLEKFDGQVTESIPEADRDVLIHQLAGLLPTLQQDPTPATSLIEILVRPASYTFARVLDIDPPVDFTAGLKALFPSINLVTLSLLEKAKFKSSDAGIVAGKPEVVAALIELWLSTSNTAVSSKAHTVLLGLLIAGERDQGATTTSSQDRYDLPAQSLMWRRVFRDKDIYESIFRICSLTNAGHNGELSKRDKSVAQARLLDLLVKIDCESIRRPQMPEVESRYGVKDGGLMEFAALKMVGYEDDVLMHMTLIDFFADLLKPGHSVIETGDFASYQLSSRSYEKQQLRAIHARTSSYYLEPKRHSSVDSTYLYGRSANYLATYCSHHPAHFLSSQSVVDSSITRLLEVLNKMTPGQWAQGSTPKHDLHVLASLPRQALLPTPTSASPLFLLSAKPPNEDALQTLATVFQGPKNEHSPIDHTPSDTESQQASAARALYWLYLDQYPTLWQHVTKAAETVALKDTALAAIALINAIVTASWAPLPSNTNPESNQEPYALPTETQLSSKCHTSQPLPPTGLLAILTPPALETVLPYLLRPAQTFSNLVGGGKGDVESAAYRVAAAKYDVLVSLKSRLQEYVAETGELQEVVGVVNKRLALGPMGGNSEVGGRIGTLEL